MDINNLKDEYHINTRKIRRKKDLLNQMYNQSKLDYNVVNVGMTMVLHSRGILKGDFTLLIKIQKSP